LTKKEDKEYISKIVSNKEIEEIVAKEDIFV